MHYSPAVLMTNKPNRVAFIVYMWEVRNACKIKVGESEI
jgi:hypothetical protein